MSKTLLYYHIVFATKKRQTILNPEKETSLFRYIMTTIENIGGKLIRINAAFNHIHILTTIPASVCVSDFVGTVKRSSSLYISTSGLFPKFGGWAREYYAESVSPDSVESVKNYIINQKEHHLIEKFEDEWIRILPEKERARWEWRFLDD
ncbi:MAG: IS200/IS605 family transposase [Muribaculaceae bacterium]|nr:IS200/IS605 family transposase [Muribaculaceae bacterium]MDE5968756.1 IS200/IS605 family transposase [Muribaculaceae bacterium]